MLSLIQKQQEQKHFGQYFTGVKLEQYKKENFSQYQRSIYIDGYLHDYASELCEIRLGEERGSQVILNELLSQQIYLNLNDKQKSVFQKLCLLYNQDIVQQIKMNINEYIPLKKIQQQYQTHIVGLQHMLFQFFNNFTLFSLGGSQDHFLYSFKALKIFYLSDKLYNQPKIDHNQEELLQQQNTQHKNQQQNNYQQEEQYQYYQKNTKFIIFNIGATLDCQHQISKDSGIESKSIYRDIIQNQEQNTEVVFFGVQNCLVQEYEYKFVKQNQKNEIFWLETDIKREKFDHQDISQQILQLKNKIQNQQNQNTLLQNKLVKIMQKIIYIQPSIQTQSGKIALKIFIKIIEKQLEDSNFQNFELIFNLNCNAINSKFCLGASEPSVIGGFDDLEMVEIFQLISIFESPLISISGFNPAIESFKTPKFIVHLIYEYTRALIEQEI